MPPAVVLLKDPTAHPVAGATGWLAPEPLARLTVLPWPLPSPLDAWTKPPPARTASSDARGWLRFVGDEPMAIGHGYVETDRGLGALLVGLRAGRAQRLQLQPMGLVTTATGSETFTLHARAHPRGAPSFDLPPRHGTEVRLPAGDYEVWARSADGVVWQRLRVAAGERALLSFVGTAVQLTPPAEAHVHPLSWPLLRLVPDAEDRTLTLRGSACEAPLLALVDGHLFGPRRAAAWPTTSRGPLATPLQDELEVHFAGEQATLAATVILGLRRNRDGSGELVCYRPIVDGRARLPAPPAGDAWLLALAPRAAPSARPWHASAAESPWPLSAGRPLTVTATDANGLPVTDLLLTFHPEQQPAAEMLARTDARGVARFGPLLAPGVLRVSDARYRNDERRFAEVPGRAVELRVTTGVVCRVTARFADGERGGTIVVTLRDPTGQLRPARRSHALAPGGQARFDGLPQRAGLVLFATATRDGRTWSARRTFLTSELPDAPLELVLRDEDPQPGDDGR